MKTVYLALGSNLGDRRANLEGARERLASAELRVVRVSSIYETAPRDVLDQPWFLNQVAEVETSLFPLQLLARTQKIERELGRKRGQPKGPRVIDIDILLFGEAIIRTSGLEVPHPRMLERRFVLEPLAELAPEHRHPGNGRRLRGVLGGVMDQVVKKLDPLSS